MPVWRRMLWVCAAMVSLASTPAFAERAPAIACVRVEKRPTLDGALDDACWQKAAWTSAFHAMHGGALPPADIWMGVAHTSEALYIGWETMKHHGSAPESATQKDFVFMFLHPEPDSEVFFEFTCGAEGKIAESRCMQYEWKGRWRAKVRPTPKGWCAEIEIPFESLEVAAPKEGDLWGFNPMRKDPTRKDGRYVSWADIGDRQKTEDYGGLVFIGDLAKAKEDQRGDGLKPPFHLLPDAVAEAHRKRLKAQTAPAQFAVRNPSFEDGLKGWGWKYSARTYHEKSPVTLAGDVHWEGGASARIASVNPNSLIEIRQKIAKPPAGTYEVSAMIRLENPPQRDGVNLYVSAGTRVSIHGGEHGLCSTTVDDTPTRDGWRRQAIRFRVPESVPYVKVGVEVIHYAGKVWIDDFGIRRRRNEGVHNDGLWFWDAWNPSAKGNKARKRLYAMVEEGSPWVEKAQRYNDALVSAAFARDALHQRRRA